MQNIHNFTLIMSWTLYLKTDAFVKSTIVPFHTDIKLSVSSFLAQYK